MKIRPRSPLLLLACLSLFTCSSLDNFESGAGGVYADPDPSLYFSRHAGKTYRAAVLSFTSHEGIAFFDAFITDEVNSKPPAWGFLPGKGSFMKEHTSVKRGYVGKLSP